mmetsp:Transcript_106855/g.300422  ORF Transcript_106855/g.300422 Transcript_106855/m.300422 type:complete len:424 (+) Transcript_106855:91-1362(+)|eukprot:CAMPEP_0117497320 /NCGR_PEP_ID=MMETSP0784-20121206/21121_1 /TAXON_ID=39447 /ORGANISM="" /LENGTH=423 /DNA_ID=CAMNT_0005292337 /DNA_START=68 /DNA_END=1339 /DNA_ORIENTATION=+
MVLVAASRLGCLVAGLLMHGALGGKVKIEAMKHDIQGITAQNFDGVISKFRDSAVSAVWFYKDDESKDQAFLDEYNKVATDLKGMAKVTALSCTDFSGFCVKQSVKETPTIMIYPTNPMPAFKYEGKMEAKAIAAKIARFLADLSTKLTSDNVDAFVTTDPTKPKVILFSNKKTPPTIWKALSSETVFRRTVKFGFVSEAEADIVKKFKVTKFPSVIMQRGAKAEIKENYKGEMNFLALKDWVNLHSESGMGDKVQGGGASGKEEESIEEAKPWLVQDIPELTAKSHQDVCFKGEGLCVIYLKEGELSTAETDMLKGLEKKFTSQLSDRGAKLRWMWMNMAVEEAYKGLFKPAMLPSAVVFNPHKRLRFTPLDHGEDNEVKGDEAGLANLLDKVLGGDARFKMVPGQKLPAWAAREAKKKAEL